MKTADIKKIRELLKNALTYQKKRKIKHPGSQDATNVYKWILRDMSKCIGAALALLPCPTCDGSGKDPDQGSLEPCPDCTDKIPNINPAETISEYPESM